MRLQANFKFFSAAFVTLGLGASLSAMSALADTSAAQNATQAASSDNSSQTASMIMAGSMAATCNKPAGNYAPCIMSALAAAQAIASGSASDGATTSATGLSTTGAATTYNNVTDASAAGNTAAASAASVKKALASAGAPVSADGSNITLPNGTSVPLTGSSGTDAGMSAAGLSQSQIDQGHAALKDALAKVAAQTKKVETGETGAAGGGVGSGSSAYSPSSPTLKGKSVTRAKPTLSGLTKNLGNDKIGVSADDIFDMVSRRYQARDSKGTFLKN